MSRHSFVTYFSNSFEFIKINQILFAENRRELLREDLRVFRTDLEAEHRSDVSEDRIFEIRIRFRKGVGFGELSRVLMCHDHSQAILPGFR